MQRNLIGTKANGQEKLGNKIGVDIEQSSGNTRNTSSSQSSAPRDSNLVRLRVIPNYAEIFVDGKSVGTNFKQIWLSIGPHPVRFSAPGCGTPIDTVIDVKKTGQAIPIPTVTIPGC